MARLLLLNGPNLNLLGSREPDKYGHQTLREIESRAAALCTEFGHELLAYQSNAEHELVGRIQSALGERIAFAIINAGALTHTSIALRDALLATQLPFIEVHLTNLASRESFRHHSYLADVAVGSIIGLGGIGYELAVRAAAARLGGKPLTRSMP